MSLPTSAPTDPPLDWPHYGIGFLPAARRAFRKYATFSGRASRGEYWWFVVFVFLGLIVLGLLSALIGVATSPGPVTADGSRPIGPAGAVLLGLTGLCYLATIVPSLSVSVRRLHDAGYSGWMVLLNLIPYVGGLVVIVLCALPTSPAAVRYGPPDRPSPATGRRGRTRTDPAVPPRPAPATPRSQGQPPPGPRTAAGSAPGPGSAGSAGGGPVDRADHGLEGGRDDVGVHAHPPQHLAALPVADLALHVRGGEGVPAGGQGVLAVVEHADVVAERGDRVDEGRDRPVALAARWSARDRGRPPWR